MCVVAAVPRVHCRMVMIYQDSFVTLMRITPTKGADKGMAIRARIIATTSPRRVGSGVHSNY